jgi:hypothetical protein
VLERLRADWRRGRARKLIELDREIIVSFETETVGKVEIQGVFSDEGDTLHATIIAFYAHDHMTRSGEHRAPLGAREIYRFLEIVCSSAADLGYRRLRLSGKRVLEEGRRREQDFTVDVDRFRRK